MILIPLIPYAGMAMWTLNSIGFDKGILGNNRVFIRTPKSGLGVKEASHRSSLTLDVPTVTEVMLSVTALAPYIAVFWQGVWFLGVSLLAFGGLALKSMNVSSLFVRGDAQLQYRNESETVTQPSLTILPLARQNSQDTR